MGVPNRRGPQKEWSCSDLCGYAKCERAQPVSSTFELNGAQWYFSKLDLSQTYNQLELEEESRYITTFSTHLGLFRYKRLNFGTNAAAEIFQHTLQAQFHGLKGVKNIADDIIVYGTTRKELDENLDMCL